MVGHESGDLQQALRAVVGGDVRWLPMLLESDHSLIRGAADGLKCHLVATTSAVARVLRGLRGGEISPIDAQRWASFIRHGHGPNLTGPIVPIDILYEPEGEDSIVEAVARMDELGDLIDGSITDEEAADLLRALEIRGA